MILLFHSVILLVPLGFIDDTVENRSSRINSKACRANIFSSDSLDAASQIDNDPKHTVKAIQVFFCFCFFNGQVVAYLAESAT